MIIYLFIAHLLTIISLKFGIHYCQMFLVCLKVEETERKWIWWGEGRRFLGGVEGEETGQVVLYKKQSIFNKKKRK